MAKEKSVTEEAKKLPLREAGFRDDLVSLFSQMGIVVLGDFTQHTKEQMVTAGIVRRRLGYVREKLATHGLALKAEFVEAKAGPKDKKVKRIKNAKVDADGVPVTLQKFSNGKLIRDGQGTFEIVDTHDRDRFFVRNQRLVHWFVWRDPWRSLSYDTENDPAIDIEDTTQDGFIGMLTAIEKYDISVGFKFSTYAFQWIRQAVSRMFLNSGLVRIPVHAWQEISDFRKAKKRWFAEHGEEPTDAQIQAELGWEDRKTRRVLAAVAVYSKRITRLQDVIGNNYKGKALTLEDTVSLSSGGEVVEVDDEEFGAFSSTKPEDEVIHRVAVRAVLEKAPLKDREKRILYHRFWEGKTLEQIGEIMDLTRERIRQIEAIALDKLRDPGLWEGLDDKSDEPEDVDGVGLEMVPTVSESTLDASAIDAVVLDAETVIQLVCTHFNESVEELTGPGRQQPLALRRQILMLLLYEQVVLTYVQIGSLLGGRNHTTIMHGCDMVSGLMDRDLNVQRDVQQLRRLCARHGERQQPAPMPVVQKVTKATTVVEMDIQSNREPVDRARFDWIDPVFDTVCEYYGVEKDDLRLKTDDEYLRTSAEVFVYLAHRYSFAGNAAIAKAVKCSAGYVSKISDDMYYRIKRDSELGNDIHELRCTLMEIAPKDLDNEE